MEFTFHYVGDITAGIPAHENTELADGFRIVVPNGFMVTMRPLHGVGHIGEGHGPGVVAGHGPGEVVGHGPGEVAGHGPGQGVGHEALPNALEIITNQIVHDSGFRTLRQSEVLHMLQHDTLVIRDIMVDAPYHGLYMYRFDLHANRDFHRYHERRYSRHMIGDQIGDEEVEVRYRRACVLPHPEDGHPLSLTSRRYHLTNAPGKFLIHYIEGEDFIVDGEPVIPV